MVVRCGSGGTNLPPRLHGVVDGWELQLWLGNGIAGDTCDRDTRMFLFFLGYSHVERPGKIVLLEKLTTTRGIVALW